VTGDNVSEVRW